MTSFPLVGLVVVVGWALSLFAAGCGHEALDRVFADRITLFANFAASLPICRGGYVPSVDELFAAGVVPGARTSVRGHPAPACTDQPVGATPIQIVNPVPLRCVRHPSVWVLWRNQVPVATRAALEDSPCVHVDPDALTEGIVLGPRPVDLMDCDGDAAEHAISALNIVATGKISVLRADRPVRGVELHVESICRIP